MSTSDKSSWLPGLLGPLDIESDTSTPVQRRGTINFIGATVTDVPEADRTDIDLTTAAGVAVQDEGAPLATRGTTLNFVGAGVVASGTGATKTITISGGGGSGSADPGLCRVRMSLTSGLSVTISDVTGATIYIGPGAVSLYTSGVWTSYIIAEEIAFSVEALDDGAYDMFLHDDGTGDVEAVISTVWTNLTTPVNALGTQDGAAVLGSDHSKKHIGTFVVESGTVTDAVAKRYLSNRYNQVWRRFLKVGASGFWDVNSAVPLFVASNNDSTNAVKYIACDASIVARARVAGLCQSTGGSAFDAVVGVGVDSTSVNSAQECNGTRSNSSGNTPLSCGYEGSPGRGGHTLYWLESGAQMRFFGLNDGINRGAMTGEILG